MDSDNRNIVPLPLRQCLLLDMPDRKVQCSLSDETTCIRCSYRGSFASGEGMNDYDSVSHVVCLIMGVFVVLIGTFGALANILIVIILKRQKTGRGFDTMLIGLAGFDLICSVTSALAAIANVSYYQNVDRGIVILHLYVWATLSAIFARSGSVFQTVLITLERYLSVAFPIKTRGWFTVKRSRYMSLGIFLFSAFLAFPRFSSNYVDENIVGKDIESTKDLDYLIMSTKLESFWYGTMGMFFDHIDFFVPLPVLLILNGLIYFHILKFISRRKDLNMSQKKDIRAIRMFLPVVIILFICNIFPILNTASLVFYSILHHELYMGLLLSYVVNAAANLPIYYYKGSSFSKETRALLFSVFPSLARYYGERYDANGARVTTTAGTPSAASRSNDKEVGDYEI